MQVHKTMHRFTIRGIASEETLKKTACSVIQYVIDTLGIPPQRILLYSFGLCVSIDMVILLVAQLVFFYLFSYPRHGNVA